MPQGLGDLGLPRAALAEHVAWDIGALDLARRLAETLDAPLIHQTYSRLVIDCNREPGRPDSIVAYSDRWEVPGNADLNDAARAARRLEVFEPYHGAIAAEADEVAARGRAALLISVHSFTPNMGGVGRPWHMGVLHLGNSAASDALLALLRAEPGLAVGDNEPYAMDGTDFTVPFHAHRRGWDAVEIEVRQDLLGDPVMARRMAQILGRLLPRLSGVR